MYCAQEGKTPADMQNFIDGPMGPDFGTNTLINTVMYGALPCWSKCSGD